MGVPTLSALIAISLLAAACGTAEFPDPASTTHSPTADVTALSLRQLVTKNGEPVIRCGPSGLPFTPSAYLGPHDHSNAGPAVVAGLERLVAEAGMDVPPALRGKAVQEAPWFVLAQSSEQVDIATGTWTADGPARDAMVVSLLWRDGRWWPGWGTCNLGRVPPPGYDWVTISLGSKAQDPTSRTVPVILSPTSCIDGREPSQYLHEPLVVEQDQSVLVYWTMTPFVPAPGADGGCAPVGVGIPRKIMLSRPLGERAVFDGSRWPPAPLERL